MSLTAEQLQETGEIAESLGEPAADPVEASRDEADRAALMALPVGTHLDVPERIYHARVLGVASNSALSEIRHTASRYRAWVDDARDRRASKALPIGKAVHCATLEPERFAREYALAPAFGDCRRRENKLERDRWNREHAGATILRNDEGKAVMGMVESLARRPLVSALLEGSRTEVTGIWEECGLRCKLRADIDNRDLCLIADVKTTEDASSEAFARSAFNFGYHRQDDWYRRGFRALGIQVDSLIFIVVEKSPPHDYALYELDEAARARGREENDVLLTRLARCVERDAWPGYPDTIQSLSLPRWAEKVSI